MEHEFKAINSKKHDVSTVHQKKVTLNTFDDKRYLLNHKFTLPYGHKDISDQLKKIPEKCYFLFFRKIKVNPNKDNLCLWETKIDRDKKNMATKYVKCSSGSYNNNNNNYTYCFEECLAYNNIDVSVKVTDYYGVPYIHFNRKENSSKPQYLSLSYDEWYDFVSGIQAIGEKVEACKKVLKREGKLVQRSTKRKREKITMIGDARHSSTDTDKNESEEEAVIKKPKRKKNEKKKKKKKKRKKKTNLSNS